MKNFESRYLSFIAEAREQVLAQSRVPLDTPAPFRVLFLAYDTVVYNGVKYKMTRPLREYLSEVANNFKYSVEKASNYNVEIIYDIEYCPRKLTVLPAGENNEFVYIHLEDAAGDLADLEVESNYDSVLTTCAIPGDVGTLGMSQAGIDAMYGYGYFTLYSPDEFLQDRFPGDRVSIPDPNEPTSLATCCAIHEWLHQLEPYKSLLDIDFPDFHAYMGVAENPAFADYETYTLDQYGDHWNFYKDYLSGNVLYKRKSLIGMYPQMWRITPRSLDGYRLSCRLRNAGTNEYLVMRDGVITVANAPEDSDKWRFVPCYGHYKIMSVSDPLLCLDNSYARAIPGNPVIEYPSQGSLEYSYPQLWDIAQNDDGTYTFLFHLNDTLAITLNADGDPLLILKKVSDSPAQRWIPEFDPSDEAIEDPVDEKMVEAIDADIVNEKRA